MTVRPRSPDEGAATRRRERIVEPWPSVDPLGEALHFLRMRGTFYSSCEFTAPWGLALPPMPGSLMFHFVTSGRCWLQVGGADPRPLQPGDLALVPHGDGHLLASTPGVPGVPLVDVPSEHVSERFEFLRQGGGGAATSLVCGTVQFDHPAASQLVSLLPRMVGVGAAGAPDAEWVASTLQVMGAEARTLRPGGEALVTRLADVLVVRAIRVWIEQDPAAQTGWLGALRDKQVGRALALVHRDPARAWTLAALAREAAMSRSAFAARFASLVGMPAMQYVARWRMHVALTWLREHDAGIADVAGRLGYHSEAAFSRAFKRVVGAPPGAVRRRAGDALGRHAAPAPR